MYGKASLSSGIEDSVEVRMERGISLARNCKPRYERAPQKRTSNSTGEFPIALYNMTSYSISPRAMLMQKYLSTLRLLGTHPHDVE